MAIIFLKSPYSEVHVPGIDIIYHTHNSENYSYII
jgi:hypothetical protein